MRSYLILKEKARHFNEDAEIQGILAEIRARDPELESLMASYNAESVGKLRKIDFEPDTLAQKGLGYEKLDQLTFEVLMGIR